MHRHSNFYMGILVWGVWMWNWQFDMDSFCAIWFRTSVSKIQISRRVVYCVLKFKFLIFKIFERIVYCVLKLNFWNRCPKSNCTKIVHVELPIWYSHTPNQNPQRRSSSDDANRKFKRFIFPILCVNSHVTSHRSRVEHWMTWYSVYFYFLIYFPQTIYRL